MRFVTVSKSEEELALEEQARQVQQAEAEERKAKAPKQVAGAGKQMIYYFDKMLIPFVDLGEAAPGTMDVRISIEDPEVVLVEDAAQPETTQAIILKV